MKRQGFSTVCFYWVKSQDFQGESPFWVQELYPRFYRQLIAKITKQGDSLQPPYGTLDVFY